MAKTPSTKLFNLIHSLSSQEKRYFKIIAKNKEESNNKYVKLFELIEDSQVFDEAYYKDAIYPNLPPKSKKYSELKGYLYQVILRRLRDYDEESSIDYVIKNGLLSIHSLFSRSKFKYALEEVNKILKLSRQHEKFKWTIELLEWKKKIAYAQADISYFDKNLSVIHQEETSAISQLANFKSYEQAFYELYLFLRKKPNQSEEDLAPFVQRDILEKPKNAQSFKALIYYHRIWSIYYFSIGNFHQFAAENEKLIHLVEGNPYYQKEDISHYISILSNHSVAGFLINNFALVESSLTKLKNLKPLTQDDAIRINRQYYSSKFKLCILSGNFEDGIDALATLQSLISEEHWHVFNNDSFLFQYFYLYFGIGDYERALNYINEWMNLPRHAERQDMQIVARILVLIIHYELDNTLLLTSLIRSSKRYLNLKQKSNILEGLFLPALSDALNKPTAAAKRTVFKTLLAAVNKLPVKSNPLLGIFDFKAWIQSQVTQEDFAVIIKEKFKQQFH